MDVTFNGTFMLNTGRHGDPIFRDRGSIIWEFTIDTLRDLGLLGERAVHCVRVV